MMWVQNNQTWGHGQGWKEGIMLKRGSSLLELAVCLVVLGCILLALSVVLEVGTKYFARAQAAQLYHLHVEPLEILLAKQVRNCRYGIYSSLPAARALQSSGLVEQGNILRADRQDGAGWFILQWDNSIPALNLITDDGVGLPFTRSIRPWGGSTTLFDTSQGFLALRCSLRVPTALVPVYGTQTSEVDYLLTLEKQM